MFYVQYDDAGNISSTVQSATAPICANQLEFEVYTDTTGKIVDVQSKVLIDNPNPPPTSDPTP